MGNKELIDNILKLQQFLPEDSRKVLTDTVVLLRDFEEVIIKARKKISRRNEQLRNKMKRIIDLVLYIQKENTKDKSQSEFNRGVMKVSSEILKRIEVY